MKNCWKKYNEIWKNVSNIIKKDFDSKPVYHEKYLKTKIKSYTVMEKSTQIFTLIKYQKKALNILIDSVYRKEKIILKCF